MRYAALPGEITIWLRHLEHLPEQQQVGIVRMLAFVIGDCPVCDGPVRRCDPRYLAQDRSVHARCRGTAVTR